MIIVKNENTYKLKPCICDLCKTQFNANYNAIQYNPFDNGYADNNFSIGIREMDKTKKILFRMCPECTEKLLELLDKHFPRLNLEEKL